MGLILSRLAFGSKDGRVYERREGLRYEYSTTMSQTERGSTISVTVLSTVADGIPSVLALFPSLSWFAMVPQSPTRRWHRAQTKWTGMPYAGTCIRSQDRGRDFFMRLAIPRPVGSLSCAMGTFRSGPGSPSHGQSTGRSAIYPARTSPVRLPTYRESLSLPSIGRLFPMVSMLYAGSLSVRCARATGPGFSERLCPVCW